MRALAPLGTGSVVHGQNKQESQSTAPPPPPRSSPCIPMLAQCIPPYMKFREGLAQFWQHLSRSFVVLIEAA